ncbi:cysteine desulfurase family protein [Thalassorhabdus alkalitolerans]|uniref:cysteine desulfurase n=1 Tax=Thalassorhabdus alkalitolerans TaxID=2282697 RepID=A0ABW0YIY2_9BACI|nr:cysteine desulfurase family protein [Thalassobacillus sp. C254]
MENIYLDYNASTPLDPGVKEAMLPLMDAHFGNPSASHYAAMGAKKAVETARKQVAGLINSTAGEIIFTSGGTESNNHVLKGVLQSSKDKGNHIVTTNIEHPAIGNTCKFLEGEGADVTYVPVDETGRVDPLAIEEAITENTILVTVMHANNETGMIQPIKEISEICKRSQVYFHTDAAQSAGKVPIDVQDAQVDFLSLAGHKLYAPKGIGALYIREGIEIESLVHGAGHEMGKRAGTENVILAAGLGKACELAKRSEGEQERIKKLRDYFWVELKTSFGEDISLNGKLNHLLPNTLNVNFHHRAGQDVLQAVPEIAASTGSACHAGSVDLSPVLRAMGVEEERGMGAVRFSLGRFTTKEEIDQALSLLKTRIQ